jgi:DNA-binding GntR family transcriptional regulator
MSVGIPSGLAPLRQQAAPLRNKIITAIRQAIETGVLEPGTRLIEKELCEQLEVSRTSLREALRELQAEGIFEQTTSRGLKVNGILREEAENAYRIRAVLEALVVEQFILSASNAEIALLAADAEKLQAAYRSGALERMIGAKHAFYDRICTGANNAIARDIISRLVLRTSSLRWRSMIRPERQQQSILEIGRLMQAIVRRDVAAARAAATLHVEHAAQSALGQAPEVLPARTPAKSRPRAAAAPRRRQSS